MSWPSFLVFYHAALWLYNIKMQVLDDSSESGKIGLPLK